MTIIDRSRNSTQSNPLQFRKSLSWRSNAGSIPTGCARNGSHSHQNFMIDLMKRPRTSHNENVIDCLFQLFLLPLINWWFIADWPYICVCMFFYHSVLSCEQNGTQKLIYSIWLSHLFDRLNKNKPLESKKKWAISGNQSMESNMKVNFLLIINITGAIWLSYWSSIHERTKKIAR